MTSPSEYLLIELSKPLVMGDETISKLLIREPTAGEELVFDKLRGTSADIAAVSLVSGVPQALIRQIRASELLRAADHIASVLKAAEDDPVPQGVDVFDMPLRKVVVHGSDTLSELKLREPSAGELEAFNRFEGAERSIVALATVAGVERLAIEKVPGGDVRRGMKFINSFMPAGPTAGSG